MFKKVLGIMSAFLLCFTVLSVPVQAQMVSQVESKSAEARGGNYYMTVKTSQGNLNVRNDVEGSTIIGKFSSGTRVKVLNDDFDGTWYYVQGIGTTGNQITGYVDSHFLTN